MGGTFFGRQNQPAPLRGGGGFIREGCFIWGGYLSDKSNHSSSGVQIMCIGGDGSLTLRMHVNNSHFYGRVCVSMSLCGSVSVVFLLGQTRARIFSRLSKKKQLYNSNWKKALNQNNVRV